MSAADHRLRWLAMTVAAFAFCGCQHRPDGFRSSFEVIDPLSTPRPPADVRPDMEVTTANVLIPAQIPANSRQPTVPPNLARDLPDIHSVVVTISFDEKGTVTDVSRSLRGLLLDNSHTDAVLSAVRDAVFQWRITPARVIHYQVRSDGDRVYLSSESLAGTVDVKFSFAPETPR